MATPLHIPALSKVPPSRRTYMLGVTFPIQLSLSDYLIICNEPCIKVVMVEKWWASRFATSSKRLSLF